MGVALLYTMNGDSGVRALKSCTKLNHPSYAMPSASPFYSTNFLGMDKSEISLDTSTPLIDLWGPAPVINSPSFQRVSQEEVRSPYTSISQSETLLGCNTSSASTASSVDLNSPFVNDSTSCSGNIQQQPGLVTSREGTYSEYQKIATWAQKHPESWSPREVLDWLYCTAEQHSLDGSKLRGEAFQDRPGADLCRMSREDFDQADPQFGGLYYEVFQSLLKSAEEFCVPTSSPLPESPMCLSFDVPSYNLPASPSGPVDSRPNPTYTINTSCHSGHDTHPSHITHAYGGYPCPTQTPDSLRNPFIYPKHDRICTQPQPSPNGEYGKPGLDPFGDLLLPDDTLMQGPYNNYVQYPVAGHHTPPYISSPPAFMPPGPPVRRPPGRPPKDKGLRDLHRPRDRRGTGKNQHLWEFIYDTLMNPMYNPQILRWENKQEGIFRFVQSEAVAQLWGNLKNNDNMTYEKLSRAMRHYYKRGILERVEGRRLVYKFSRTAMERRRQQQHSV